MVWDSLAHDATSFKVLGKPEDSFFGGVVTHQGVGGLTL